jgi:hypothetical protein
MRGREDRGWSDTEWMTMENEVLITAIFVSAGLLAYVIIPGLFVFRAEGEDEKPTGFVVWDRVLDYMAGY